MCDLSGQRRIRRRRLDCTLSRGQQGRFESDCNRIFFKDRVTRKRIKKKGRNVAKLQQSCGPTPLNCLISALLLLSCRGERVRSSLFLIRVLADSPLANPSWAREVYPNGRPNVSVSRRKKRSNRRISPEARSRTSCHQITTVAMVIVAILPYSTAFGSSHLF